MMRFMSPDWTNPFAQFLKDADSAFRKIPQQSEVNTDASLLPSFVERSEARRFVLDIVDRIKALATAFDRLRTLYESYVHGRSKMDQIITEQRERYPNRIHFEIPDELIRERDQHEWEARALVAFTYYEMSTIVALLGKPFKPPPNSHLEYLVGVRNKILVHPRRNAFIKNSRSVVSIGPILHTHLVGADSWVPRVRDCYLQELREAGGWLQDDEGSASNIALLRSNSQVEDFTRIERLRLKSYAIREPDLLGSATDMAALLQEKFVPQIRGACHPAGLKRVKKP